MISDLRPGERLASPLLCTRADVRDARNGPYLALELRDRSASIEARKWQASTEDIAAAKPCAVVHVTARVTSYQGQTQLEVERIASSDEPVSSFLRRSQRDPGEMLAELRERIASHVREPLRRVVLEVLRANETALLRAPAAKSNHHAFVGGLLEHTLGMVGLAVSVWTHAEGEWPGLVDLSLLVAGAALHDIGKVREIDPASGYTTDGQLRGHVSIGAAMVREALGSCAVGELEALDLEVRLLEHLILSHHGQLEWGAAVVPRTAEAVVLHQLDMLHSRLGMVAEAIAGVVPGTWSEFVRPLGTALHVPST
jgi:3'-5' exoribonuclease